LIGAIIVAFYFCWKMAVACLVLAPFMAIGKSIALKTQIQISKATQAEEKDSDLLCGDTLTNFKTIQSFGHEEEIIKMYERYLNPVFKISVM
jgi:ABC-type multidrug transport system fused ATPase/permease subunit